ncbi:MAG: MFS transporter [Alphaproteobacteria bacterium]|nr:MFS transporter [Alphaproteobacteria bacterium]
MSKYFVTKKFFPLLTAHLFSSVSDSFMRMLFLFMATYRLTKEGTGFVISGIILYALAFFAGSTIAGQFADKFSKKKFLVLFQAATFVSMLFVLGTSSFETPFFLWMVMAGLGFIGACLRVANDSLTPSLVPERSLLKANALMKITSLLGTGVAAFMMMLILKEYTNTTVVCLFVTIFALFGLLTTLLLPAQAAVDPDTKITKNPVHVFDDISENLKFKFDEWAYLIGIAWFWVLMSLTGMMSAEYGQEVLQARWSTMVFLSAVLYPIGYILGSIICVRGARKTLGSQAMWVGILMSVVLFDFAFASRSVDKLTDGKALTIFQLLTTNVQYWRIMIDVLVLGILSALYLLPFFTLLQMKTPTNRMGRVFAFSGLLNSVMMACAFLVVIALRFVFFDLIDVVMVFALANIIMSLYFVRLLPLEQRRKCFRKVFTWLFKAKIQGLENLPKEGERCLIVTNHTNFMDVLLISTFVPRPIVFSISNRLLNKTLMKFMTNLVDLRPLDPVSPFAVKTMVEELRQDKMCMIFNAGLVEGGHTRLKMYEGAAMMALKGNAPIVPIRIDGACHTFFSRIAGKKTWFKAFPKITLTVLPPVKFSYPDSMPNREQRMRSSGKLYDIISNMLFDSFECDRTVFEAVSDAMKMRGHFFKVMEDTARKPMSYAALFLKSVILGRLIQRAIPDDEKVGVMIPTSSACALTFMGLQAHGKIPAMINFTAGPKAVVAGCKTIGLKTIVTAHKVVQLAKLESLISEIEKADVKVLYLEDLKPTLTTWDKIVGMYGALFPSSFYHKIHKKHPVKSSDTAVILFTSGSEGMPKAVLLSHYNLLSNDYQVVARFDLYPTDVFLNCLPLFHSFGLGAGTIMPLILGVKTFLYPTPLHYRIIPEIAASIRATIFFSTDTFLSAYARCANPYDFNSLRIVAGGAEKIKEETRTIWQDKFGVRLFEGYGATECSPFISVNTFLHQKKDSVGRLFTGIQYKLKPVDGIKEGGELWVKGPNIMQGYMRYENPLVLDPPKDGWYNTGDIVSVDEDGFISIKGRSKRFAKIGGEMVSLLAVEQVIAKKWPDFIIGAVSIPDAKKGEQIVLVTTCKDITKDALIALFKQTGMTELGLPTKVIVTDTPPLLGTGKFDYVKAKELALAEN